MLVIRFSRVGKRNHAQYRIVVAEKSFPVKGKFIEQLGSYDPHQKTVNLEEDKIKDWISKGASCSDSVHNLLIKEGMLKEKKKRSHASKKKGKDGEDESKEEDKKAEVKKDEGETSVEDVKKEEAEKSESKEGKKEEPSSAETSEDRKEDSK